MWILLSFAYPKSNKDDPIMSAYEKYTLTIFRKSRE